MTEPFEIMPDFEKLPDEDIRLYIRQVQDMKPQLLDYVRVDRRKYLSVLIEVMAKREEEAMFGQCDICGHYAHPDAACTWHAGSCEQAEALPALRCQCEAIKKLLEPLN